jgi:NAD(P)-dependent dehydrogenase (short-subunit alcohol dehydrogenase family)
VPSLSGRVAIVAGATRGAGRGIARMLGEAGATVYCTGRSTRDRPSDLGRPETIDETAALVDAAGGTGIAVRVDHTDEDQVRDLVARVRAEQGRLDLLVNDVWGGDALTEWGKRFWEVSLEHGRTLLDRAIWSHVVTAHHAAPLLVESGAGLIVEVTDGDFYGYRGHVFYDLVKTSVIRLAFIWARELRRTGVSSVALTPGFLRSERMLEHFGVTADTWRDAGARDPNFLASETPCFTGRAVVALATDPNVRAKSGRVFSTWALAREYGFTDIDGARPDWGAHFERTYGSRTRDGTPMRICDDGFYAYWNASPVEVAFPDGL